MNLSDTIYAHARVLPVNLQREALNYIDYLSHRHQVAPDVANRQATEVFIKQFAGSIADDFPDDVDELDLSGDVPRESLE